MSNCIISNCNHKNKYGNYCFKHKHLHLTKNNMIIKNKFTYNPSDYLKNDIRKTLKDYYDKMNNKKNISKLKKHDLFILLTEELKNIEKIILIQRYYKRYLYLVKGPGYKNKELSKNLEDFYTLENINEIKLKYFISYKDKINNIWCYDIRSIKQLIDSSNKNRIDILNPYNREIIDNKIISKIKKIIKKYSKNNISLIHDDDNIIYSREQILKMNTIDIFSEITRLGYFIDFKWFDSKNIILLKNLYKYLEDIWNYRAQLDFETKKKIAPPNGILYSISVRDVYNINSRIEVKEIIINELKRIYDNCDDNNYKILGYMYFIIGLSQVSQSCYDSHSSWVSVIL